MMSKKLFNMPSAEEMDRLYDEAREGFRYLINVPDNKSIENELQEDLGIYFTDITMQNKEIQIFWFHENTADDTIEVFLTLLGKEDREIGEYVYVIDHEGNGVDDRFFYTK
ncbi:hypothetical protein M2306_002609 [Myroides gitamensis]|uniref:hypothetical protein n=1 Tax=Myroides odoratus TaxID=256 RepID=UPI002166CF8A|nr:hypothetical protein [Myroides odoratus]MCS4237355.1 hypothetical protein [Myroides odoratus]MDH6601915.1 hypothetical protein [Myroides gitamensis]